MTDTPIPPRDDDPEDLLAAEYVLGVLALPERLAAERRVAREPAFAARVAAWENRLAPLNDGFAEVAPPPALLGRIEARLFPAAPTRRGRVFWARLLGGAATATAAVAIAVALLGPPAPVPVLPDAPRLTAGLASEDGALVFAAVWDSAGQTLRVEQASGAAPAADSDYEVWLIGPSGVPESMGLLGADGLERPLPELAEGFVLAVSLEPAGGSDTGAPTGPVLAAAAFAAGG